jgi:hypothetical protein
MRLENRKWKLENTGGRREEEEFTQRTQRQSTEGTEKRKADPSAPARQKAPGRRSG